MKDCIPRAPIRVAVCDADPLARGALAGFVTTWTDCELVSTGSDAVYARRVLTTPGVDVVLLDARTLRVPLVPAPSRRARVLYLTAGHDAAPAADFAVGVADALLSKDSDPHQLAAAVRGVYCGLKVLSRDQLRVLRSSTTSEPRYVLPPRQAQVLELVCRGWPNTRIAATMHLSLSSVKAVVSELLHLLGATNRVVLTRRAVEEGIFVP